MPFMIFDQAKSATGLLYYFSGMPATTTTLQTAATSQQALAAVLAASTNFKSAAFEANGKADSNSNGTISFGAYICDNRQLKANLFDDANQNGQIDPGETVTTTASYSGRGFYSFDGQLAKKAADAPVNEPVEYHKVYQSAVRSYDWTVEEFATGYRSGVHIHAGNSGRPNLADRVTNGCIRVDEKTLDSLDKLHGIAASTDPQKVATALIVVKDVQYISGRSLTNSTGNVALIDPSLYAADGNAGYVQSLTAGAGNDFLYGGNQRNVLNGGAGNDHIFGRGGSDSIVGGVGSDRLYGGTGDDSIVAGSSKTDQSDKIPNLVNGGWGADSLYGSGGNDKLIGQQGADVLRGGDGNDIMIGDFSYSGYLSSSTAPKDPSDAFNRLLQEDGAWKPSLNGRTPIKAFFLEKTGGNDQLFGGNGDDFLFGGFADDRLLGEDGNDWLIGSKGLDNLDGGLGNDLIFGGEGRDILTGADGSDTFYFRAGDVVSGEQIDGGNGIDTIALVQPGTVDLSTSTIFGVSATVSSIEDLLGSAGDDTLIGSTDAPTTINGGAGADTAVAGDRNDWVSGDTALTNYAPGTLSITQSGPAITVAGTTLNLASELTKLQRADGPLKSGVSDPAPGSDKLRGEAGHDVLFGGAANDRLWGGDDNDLLLGGVGNDTISGEDGHDRLGGGAGADVMNGGAGDDFYLVDDTQDQVLDPSGTDTVLFGKNGTYSLSRIEIAAITSAVSNATITIEQLGSGIQGVDLAVLGSSTSMSLTLQYYGAAEFEAAIYGGGGNDIVRLEGALADSGEFHFLDITSGDQIDLRAYAIDEKISGGVIDIRAAGSVPNGTYLLADDVQIRYYDQNMVTHTANADTFFGTDDDWLVVHSLDTESKVVAEFHGSITNDMFLV